MIDADLIIKALGEKGGIVKAVTDDETVTIYVMDGFTSVHRTPRCGILEDAKVLPFSAAAGTVIVNA